MLTTKSGAYKFFSLNSKTKSASFVLIILSLLCICYTLTMSLPGLLSKDTNTEIIINDRRQAFVEHKVYNIVAHDLEKEKDTGAITQLQASDHTIQQRCRVHMLLNNLDKYYSEHSETAKYCSRILYNRVPKCGSRTVLSTFRILSNQLNYSIISVEKPSVDHHFFSPQNRLVSFVENFTEFESPFLYSQHLHFVNFTRFRIQTPIYINVIRDPVERQISHYYYNAYGSSNKPRDKPLAKFNKTIDACVEANVAKTPCFKLNEIIPYFCGHQRRCRVRNNYSLQQAKRVASEHVLVIGFTEDLPSFMEVLEFVLPNYFGNAVDVFNRVSSDLKKRTKTANKPYVKPETIDKLKEHLHIEYEFYNFAQQRFYNLLRKIRRIKADLQMKPTYRNKRDFFKWWTKAGTH